MKKDYKSGNVNCKVKLLRCYNWRTCNEIKASCEVRKYIHFFILILILILVPIDIYKNFIYDICQWKKFK